MKNIKGCSVSELIIVIMIILILAAVAVPVFMRLNDVKVKEDKKFSQDNLYSENTPEYLFQAKLMGRASCDGGIGDLKVYEFCYNGVKYFTIENGYMAPKMIKASTGVVHHETCD